MIWRGCPWGTEGRMMEGPHTQIGILARKRLQSWVLVDNPVKAIEVERGMGRGRPLARLRCPLFGLSYLLFISWRGWFYVLFSWLLQRREGGVSLGLYEGGGVHVQRG